MGSTIGVIKGDSRSLDSGSHALHQVSRWNFHDHPPSLDGLGLHGVSRGSRRV